MNSLESDVVEEDEEVYLNYLIVVSKQYEYMNFIILNYYF